MKNATVKYLTTILLLLFVCNVYGQKWHLNRINNNKKFKYEYWFNFDNVDDSTSYSFKKQKGNSLSSIHLTDNYGDTIFFASITIKSLDNDSIVSIAPNASGYEQFKLNSGRYKIDVSFVGYDRFSLEFNLLENEAIDLNIGLGSADRELTIYQINSEIELTEKEIIKIIDCVKKNRSNPSHCRDLIRKKYSISMHI